MWLQETQWVKPGAATAQEEKQVVHLLQDKHFHKGETGQDTEHQAAQAPEMTATRRQCILEFCLRIVMLRSKLWTL